jgi:hypothetical protein
MIKRAILTGLTAIVLTALAAAVPAHIAPSVSAWTCRPASPPAPGTAPMTEEELTALYLGIVEDAVSVYEPIWTDESRRVPNSGFFDVRKYDDWTPSYKGYAGIVTIPLNGLVDFCYSILLNETDKPYFTAKKTPRAVLLDHAIKSIRWCCLTSVYVKNHYPYIYEDTAPQFLEGRYWRREFGYRADEVGFLTLAAARLWNQLDAETRGLVEEVMIGGAPKERFLRTWSPPQGGNHDQVKQDLGSTIGAAYLFPGRPDRALYEKLVGLGGLDLVSTLHDFANPTAVLGKPVRDWADGWNLYQDYSSDHHGWAQMWYGSDLIFEGWFYVNILSRRDSSPMPTTFTYPGNGFEGVSSRISILCLPEGDPISVHGMEYDSYYGSGLLAHLYRAVFQKDPVAAALEERAALLLKRNSDAVREYDYHRNNRAKAGVAYLTHKYGGGRAEPLTFDKAWAALSGTFRHPWWQNLLHRSANKLASFSWGTASSGSSHFGGEGAGVVGHVIPARLDEADPEPLIYIHPSSITGEVDVTDAKGQKFQGPVPADLYRFRRDDAEFHTAGRVTIGPVEQRSAFFSFDDGPCVFVNLFKAADEANLTWTGIPTYFYVRPGMTSSRRFFDAAGERKLELPYEGRSSWWCVNDRLGAVMLDGADGGKGARGAAAFRMENDVLTIKRTVGRNWARTDAYKDKCDTITTAAVRGAALKPGQIAGDAAAVFYPEWNHAAVADAARTLKGSALDLPAGWRGWVIPGKKGPVTLRHLAVANLDGEARQAQLSLTFDEGAPLLSLATLVQGKGGLTPVRLARFETCGETIDAYVESLGATAVEARRLSLGRYSLKPAFGKTATVRLRLANAAGPLQVMDAQGKTLPEVAPGRRAADGYFFDISGEVNVVDRAALDRDRLGPAVEIGDVVVREDGRATVPVIARDQSGISQVTIFMDGKEVDSRETGPWVWAGWPGKGYHTFTAVARDASPRHNERKSDALTIRIPKHYDLNE